MRLNRAQSIIHATRAFKGYGSRLLLLMALAATAACQDPDTAQEPAMCIPDEDAFKANALPALMRSCGGCHGENPDYGAPYSLTDYEFLVSGKEGVRPVDRIIARIHDGTMPPAPYPAPAHADFDTMMLWASCGEEHPDYQAGLTSTAPVFLPPEQLPTGTSQWAIRANNFHIPPDRTDHYQCFAMDVPFTEERVLKRIEVDIDNSRVLHHVVLFRDTNLRHDRDQFRCTGFPSDSDFLYAWAPGQDAIQFPSGGVLAKPGERYILQIHYNNAAGFQDAYDDTGIVVHHSPREEPAYSMFVPGPEAILVAPNKEYTVTGLCDVTEEMTLLAGMPHMHEIGKSFSFSVERANGDRISLVELSGWSFEAQMFYEMPITVYPGDVLRTTCTFHNTRDTTVFFGEDTSEEMCFNFLYVTPANNKRFCSNGWELE